MILTATVYNEGLYDINKIIDNEQKQQITKR